MLEFPRWKVVLVLGICALSALLTLPNFFSDETLAGHPWLPARKVSLGLDLRGGSHLLLELDFDAYLREQTTNLVDEIRARLRAANVGYRGLAAKDGKIAFSLREKPEKPVETLLREISPDLAARETGPLEYEVGYGDRWLTETKSRIVEQSLAIVGRRIDETGTKEPIIQRQGTDRILLQVPGLDNPEHLKTILGKTAKMTFHMVDESVDGLELEKGLVPPGSRIVQGDERDGGEGGRAPKYAIHSKVMLSGDMLVDAHPSYDENGEPSVAFRFNAAGARKFGEITTQNTGKPFAIVLDNRVITAPVIRTPILGGSGIITGSFTVESATDLALLLRAGALPAPLKIIEERSVGPSLGTDSIEAGKLACLVGLAGVLLFMMLMYGLFGVFANIALVVNGLLVFAMMSLMEATLTMPGIAGFVLTLGMAVDTNVLIYERIREEVKNGKTVYAAVESGFRMAFGTIIDSHTTTLIAAAILYYFGTGAVRGFAVTLSIGLIASLFTAVMFTRFLIVTWLRRTRPKVLPI